MVLWWHLVAERRESILRSTGDLAHEADRNVAEGVRAYVSALEEFAGLWALVGRRPITHWRADVGMFLRNFPAVDYVAWVEPDGELFRIHPGSMRQNVDLAGLETLVHTPTPTILGPERDAEGRPSFRLAVPVGPGGRNGELVARIDIRDLLDERLGNESEGYALLVSWSGEELFSRDIPSSDPWQDWWKLSSDVQLPYGISWKVVHRPTAALAAERLTPLPHYLLASGLALSLLAAALMHQLRVTLRQARFLEATNRALQERGEELEARVAERTRELESVVGELRAFNQTVSHDLRSPLGAILNFTAILEDEYRERILDAEGLAMLARVQRSAGRAMMLLEGLQSLSRAGRIELDISSVDMGALAREIFAQVRVAEMDRDVELSLGELPRVQGDRTLLADVLSNLFTNALKYSRGREKRRIEVRGFVEGEECIFEVADNGRGFDMRFRDKVFGMFERLDPDDVEGTGVGLAIVERIVRRHGGRVWAESRLGEGASFFFALPATLSTS